MSIPASAGNTIDRLARRATVHPRTRGATASGIHCYDASRGPCPLLRGPASEHCAWGPAETVHPRTGGATAVPRDLRCGRVEFIAARREKSTTPTVRHRRVRSNPNTKRSERDAEAGHETAQPPPKGTGPGYAGDQRTGPRAPTLLRPRTTGDGKDHEERQRCTEQMARQHRQIAQTKRRDIALPEVRPQGRADQEQGHVARCERMSLARLRL